MAEQGFASILMELSQKRGREPAVTCGDDALTFSALDCASNRLARAYQELGVNEGDFVTIALPNSIEFVVSSFAIWKLGATPQPVSYRLPKAELQGIVDLADTPLVVGARKKDLPERIVLETGFSPRQELSSDPLPEKIAKHWKAPTSGGSTGRPKLIVSATPAVFDIASPAITDCPNDRAVLIPGPLYHNAPFSAAFEALLRGNHVVVMEKFDAEACLALIERYSVDWTVMVPTMMHRIWRLGEGARAHYNLSSLRVLLHAAAACPLWLKEAWIEWLGPKRILELYGGTEGQGFTLIGGDEWLARKGSVGRVYPGYQMKILGKDGTEQPPGKPGEIYFLPNAGQGSTYHYIGARPDAIEGGWETLGDIGYVDEEGYLYLCDRRKDLIISGGANIYPAEVEAAIEAHPNVRSSIVVGLADTDLGQRVHALVDAPDGLDESTLIEHLSEQLVRYKIPRSFEFVAEPLRDDAGKARRMEIAAARQSGAH